MKSIDTNPLLESIRAAYRASAHYRSRNREPGSDDEPINAAGLVSSHKDTDETGGAANPVPAAPALGIPWDDLEREFADRMQP